MTGVQTCALPICFPVTIFRFNRELYRLGKVVKDIPNVGWCLDTHHAHAAGVPVDEIIDTVNEYKPDVVHLNFPGAPFGSGRDRHGWRSIFDLDLSNRPSNEVIQEKHQLTVSQILNWDKLARHLNSLNLPLILEGSSETNSDLTREFQTVRYLLSTDC